MIITQQKYLDMLVAGQGNGLVKIVTGGRRCGKSFLLFQIFHQYLLQHGVDEGHLIEVSLDDRRNRKLCDPDALLDYLDSRIKSDGKTNFIFLDEIQLVDDFIGVLLSLMHTPNTEVYVSGSNSKFLSKDVVTEFRGRGQEIRIWPLSFSEYYGAVGGERSQAWKDYYTFEEKQERRSLINIADNFRKVIVVKDDIKRKIDDDGVVTIGLFDFLLDEQSIERY